MPYNLHLTMTYNLNWNVFNSGYKDYRVLRCDTCNLIGKCNVSKKNTACISFPVDGYREFLLNTINNPSTYLPTYQPNYMVSHPGRFLHSCQCDSPKFHNTASTQLNATGPSLPKPVVSPSTVMTVLLGLSC